MGDFLSAIGLPVVHAILTMASLVKMDYAPGIVVLLFSIAFLLCSGFFLSIIYRRQQAIDWFTSLLKENISGGKFSSNIDLFTNALRETANDPYKKRIFSAWESYDESLIKRDFDGSIIVQNVARPSFFFNPDDLGFGLGSWRIVSGLFVSIGLFFTFLGLVSALSTMGQGAEIDSNVMRQLLTVASAKFIMSLTGLFFSILFTLLMRVAYGRLEAKLHKLCDVIEIRLSFVSLEDLATQQLQATIDQREHFRAIGTELVAQLSRPLREELPQAIERSMQAAVGPVMEKISKMGTDGVGDMVSGLSNQLAGSVTSALSDVGERIADAGTRLGQLADRLDKSSGQIGSDMEGVSQNIVKAVDDLRMAAMAFKGDLESASRNEAEAVQQRMQATSQQVSTTIGNIGNDVAATLSRSSEHISRVVGEMTEKAGEELVAPLTQMKGHLEQLIGQLNNSTMNMVKMSEGVQAGADATQRAATSFNGASNLLVEAVSPVRIVVERMDDLMRSLTNTTQNVATTITKSSEMTARSAANSLAAAEQILMTQSKAMEQALAGVTTMLERMKGQGDRLDTMDQKLGEAFELYTQNVRAAIQTLQKDTEQIARNFGPALDTMREIVEQAEQFAPQQNRRP
ncbi:hypothetical protein [Bartonella sp. HY761]|uniref:hypothetical protein n=1 Tax=Bartonella sp. HY761 TaxID=2979330 RepID=UPI00220E2590|nr:hypothetical protein [Bartonella sp. HY761]UXN05424.1 hypothetical protein N6A79_08890 [Bartonella sp. HY761]